MGSFKASPTSLTGEVTIKTSTANAVGGGADGGATAITTHVSKVNGEIKTVILVDLEDLLVSGTVKDIIGEDGVAAAYLTQITTAVNGIIYKAEMSCIEVPAGSNTTADIDLVSNSASLAEDVEYDGSGTATVLIAPGGAFTAGMARVSNPGTDLSNCVDDYLYLANGSGSNSGGTYTGGKFIITLTGASF
jgi:hypothetical protein